MALRHSKLARRKVPSGVRPPVPLSGVSESHREGEKRAGGHTNKVVERTAIAAAAAAFPSRQKNMADSLALVRRAGSWQHVAIAGNEPKEGKNYEAAICQRGSERTSGVLQLLRLMPPSFTMSPVAPRWHCGKIAFAIRISFIQMSFPPLIGKAMCQD